MFIPILQLTMTLQYGFHYFFLMKEFYFLR